MDVGAFEISKTSSVTGTVDGGDTVTYTIVVSNSSPSIVSNVVVHDTLPTGVTYVPASSSVTYPIDSATSQGTFSTNLGSATFDTPGLVQSFSTVGQLPAGATLLTYAISVSGLSLDWLSDISLSATYPSGTAFTLPAGTFGGNFGGNFIPNPTTRGPTAFGGTALGTYQFIWNDGFNGVGGDDNQVQSAISTITYSYPSVGGRGVTNNAAGNPSSATSPNLITTTSPEAGGIRLLPGESMTITFDVTIDDPLVAASFINTAEVNGVGASAITGAVTNVTADAVLSCPVSDFFAWDDGLGNGAVWNVDDSINTYLNVAGSGIDVTVQLIDPFNQNIDTGNPGTSGFFTQTTGSFGNDYLTVSMTSQTDLQTMILRYTFSQPVLMESFEIADIDSVGYGFQPTVEPGDSFQDEVSVVASNGASSVPVTISTVGGSSPITVVGQNAVAPYTVGVNRNLLPTDANGQIIISALAPLTSLDIIYSDGPADAIGEANGGEPAPHGESNDHSIRLDGFSFCEAPVAGIQLIKLADSAPDGTTNTVNAGSNVIYSYDVINTGDTYLSSITVTDDVLGVVGTIAGPLAPGATNTLFATNLNVTADVTNIGTATGNPSDNIGRDIQGLSDVTDTDDAIVEVSVTLVVTCPSDVTIACDQPEQVFTNNVLDEFNVETYSNNNGSVNWNGPWVEFDGGGVQNPSTADIRVWADGTNTFVLRVQDDDRQVQRAVNLDGAASATLSFDFRRQGLNATSEYVALEISTNSGVSWVELDRFAGPATDSSYTSTNYDISAYATLNTLIRYLTPTGLMEGNDDVYFDNIDITYTFSAPTSPAPSVIVSDCGPPPSIAFVDTESAGACVDERTLTREWTVRDDCGNAVMCTQTVSVVDTTAPVITCPADATVECDGDTSPTGTGSATATDNCDGTPSVSSSDTVTAGACADEETISRVWTATDNCGNSSVCTQTITVVDTTAPVITCPADTTVECDGDTSPTGTGSATATDNCDGTPSVSSVDTVTAGACADEETISRVWTATDNCGNSSVCTQTITVVDTTAPVITCPADATVECDGDTSPTGTGSATATDNCDGTPSVSSADTVTAGACADEETISRVWTATDNCGNSSVCTQTITVVDTTAPVITCPADATVECDGDTSPTGTGSATATDNCDGTPSVSSVDTVTAGACADEETISRVWTVTDNCGNSSVCTQTITVVDTTAPVITCPADATVECDGDTSPTGTGSATATDNCDGTPSVSSADTVTAGACADEETISRVWTATDNCGNSSVCTQTITVVDTTAPVITCPADVTVECDGDTSPTGTGSATATDNCDGTPSVSSADTVTAGACADEETISRVWTATDNCGNSSVCTQTITVVDTTAPMITCPADATVECDGDTSPTGTGTATATDNCDGTPSVNSADTVAAGACADEETISRVWTATDNCGNSSVCTQTITVVDTTAPVITCPADVTVECDGDTSPTGTGSATATDNCDGAPSVTSADTVTAGACADEETISRVWTATDNCGNSSVCTQTITVVDTTAPVITCPADATVECDGDTSPTGTGSATATDNCDGTPSVSSADTVTAGACADEETISRVWTATDNCGTSSVCTQTITVVDTTAPVITCPADVTVECDGDTSPTGTGSATATDNCDGTPFVSSADTVTAGACVDEETISRVWTATDNCGNSSVCTQTITVVDTTAPVITCPADATVECDGDTSPTGTGSATATDNCDGTPSVSSADTVTAGACADEETISRVWTATDNCGNSSVCTQTITVVDTTAPVITCPADVTVECDGDTSPTGTGSATATDNCDGTPFVSSADTVTAGACVDEETISRVWTATDNCGNSSVCTQTITVVDTTAPVITCPPDVTLGCGGDTNVLVTGTATATDNCDVAPAVTYVDVVTSNFITRTWTVTDACGNTSQCDQVLTLTPCADLAVYKRAVPEPAVAGELLQYTILVTNRGPDDATGVVVTDVLAPNVSFQTATPSVGSYDAGTGIWNIGAVVNGGSETLVIDVLVNPSAP